MCGIIGYKPLNDSTVFDSRVTLAMAHLVRESRIRGLHALGMAQPLGFGAFSQYISHDQSDWAVHRLIDFFDPGRPAIIHARYATSGWANQPIVVGNRALAFNGVIHMGTKEEFERAFRVTCDTDNDGEVFLRRLMMGDTPEEFIGSLKGSFAGVWFQDSQLWAGRNEYRPLWKVEAFGATWYASTDNIFWRAFCATPRMVAEGVERA